MPKAIDRVGVQHLIEHGAQIVDVLPAREYKDQHLPGAMNIPLKQLTAETTAGLQHDQPVIVYCWDYQ